MKDFAPMYYDKFKCIADKCRHNCCIDWEVDIDEHTLKKYKRISSPLGDKIKENICTEDEVSYFKMTQNKRCPFLRDDNLCQIICEKGSRYLCDICREHPRFYNFFTDRTEYGLGLCCEEAARIILSSNKKFTLDIVSDDRNDEENDDFENYVIFMRNECINIIEENDSPLSERLETMLRFCDTEQRNFTPDELYDLFVSLEMLDEAWGEKIKCLREKEDLTLIDDENFTGYFEKLAVYFIYRQLSSSVYDAKIKERAAFVSLSVRVITALCRSAYESGNLTFNDICEAARAYSSETEYSEENIYHILNSL